jgi:ribosomal protein L3 glutamine methyltransferase
MTGPAAMTVLALVELMDGRRRAGRLAGGFRPRHHQRLRRSRLAGAVEAWLPLDDLDSDETGRVARRAGKVAALLDARISTRKPAAYLTREAWLQGVPFYVDERAIVPRSFIAELLADGSIDPWLGPHTQRVLDLCTGNGSLAVLAAITYPDVRWMPPTSAWTRWKWRHQRGPPPPGQPRHAGRVRRPGRPAPALTT